MKRLTLPDALTLFYGRLRFFSACLPAAPDQRGKPLVQKQNDPRLKDDPSAYSGDVNGRFQRDVNGHSGHVNKVGAQRRWDYNHARHLRD